MMVHLIFVIFYFCDTLLSSWVCLGAIEMIISPYITDSTEGSGVKAFQVLAIATYYILDNAQKGDFIYLDPPKHCNFNLLTSIEYRYLSVKG